MAVYKVREFLAALVTWACFTVCCGGTALAAPKEKAAVAPVAGKVDLNTATSAELEKLPGIGPASAKKIIAGRPYKSAADLSKAGLPAKTVEKITPLVTVGSVPAAAKQGPAVSPPHAAKPLPAAQPTAKAAAPAKAAKQVPPPAGKGMVWVNPDSKIYHPEGSRWYGKTKTGSYMTEAEAVKAGYRPAKSGSKEK